MNEIQAQQVIDTLTTKTPQAWSVLVEEKHRRNMAGVIIGVAAILVISIATLIMWRKTRKMLNEGKLDPMNPFPGTIVFVAGIIVLIFAGLTIDCALDLASPNAAVVRSFSK